MTYPRPLYIYFKKPHRSCQPLLTTTTILTAAHPLSDRLVMRCGSHLAWSGAPCSVLTMRSIKVMNITDRHEMTGKDQNQSEGKVWNTLSSLPSWLGASCLLTGDVCLSGFHSEACLKSDSLSYEWAFSESWLFLWLFLWLADSSSC